MTPFIIVGLGNPGEEYLNSRHNTGRFLLEAFARANDFPEFARDKKIRALVSEGKIGKEKVLLVLPETFMNRSGASVALLIKSKKAAERLAVIHDDLDIPFGMFKISFNKSSGGHRGVESMIRAIKTRAFVRVRVGIARSAAAVRKSQNKSEVEKIILGKFKSDELSEMKKLSKKISEALAVLVAEGREKAMSQQRSF